MSVPYVFSYNSMKGCDNANYTIHKHTYDRNTIWYRYDGVKILSKLKGEIHNINTDENKSCLLYMYLVIKLA